MALGFIHVSNFGIMKQQLYIIYFTTVIIVAQQTLFNMCIVHLSFKFIIVFVICLYLHTSIMSPIIAHN